jgi:hypothetical protein
LKIESAFRIDIHFGVRLRSKGFGESGSETLTETEEKSKTIVSNLDVHYFVTNLIWRIGGAYEYLCAIKMILFHFILNASSDAS